MGGRVKIKKDDYSEGKVVPVLSDVFFLYRYIFFEHIIETTLYTDRKQLAANTKA